MNDLKLARRLSILGGIFFAFYLLGMLLPEVFWGTHFAAFLPRELLWPLLLIAAVLIVSPLIIKPTELLQKVQLSSIKTSFLLVYCLLLGLAFWFFPIFEDSYGDAIFIQPNLQKTVTELTSPLVDQLLYFDPLDSKMGMTSNYGVCFFLSWLTGLEARICWHIWVSFAGILYVFLWGKLVSQLISNPFSQYLFLLLGSLAPFTQMFYGHIEIYAISMPLLMAYFYQLILCFRQNKVRQRWLLVILFLLCLKFHVTAYLLFPSLILAFLNNYAQKRPAIKPFFQWTKLQKWGLVPCLMVGAFVYFFITKSQFATRSFTSETMLNVLFLPIQASDSAPLDRYNLFSFAHLWDYIQVAFIWSPSAIFLLVATMLFFGKHFQVKSPIHATITFTLLLYLIAFFFLNPLLSLPLDWDLFSMVAPVLWVFVLLTFENAQLQARLPLLAAPLLSFMLLGSSFMFVNARAESLSQRLESLGIYVAQTYWKGYSTILYDAFYLEEKQEIRELRLTHAIEKLEATAVIGMDPEFADILREKGTLRLEANDFQAALTFFEKAFKYSPNLSRNVIELVRTHYLLGNFAEAHQHLERLVGLAYPSKGEALAVATEVAVFADQYEDAKQYCEQYLILFPEDSIFGEVYRLMTIGQDLKDVKQFLTQLKKQP